MSEIDYAARVQRGAALLDKRWPTWAQDIDLGTLDIENGDHCMTAQYAQSLGNADADWYDGMRALGLYEDSDNSYAAHGFNAEPDYEADYASEGAFAILNDLWRDLIQERRAQARPEASER